jgi:hypothetical protein
VVAPSISGSRFGRSYLCGHFRRIRYGAGLEESRLEWIQRMLVNAVELVEGATVKTNEYVVR